MDDEKKVIPDIEGAEVLPDFLAADKWFGVDTSPYILDFTKNTNHRNTRLVGTV